MRDMGGPEFTQRCAIHQLEHRHDTEAKLAEQMIDEKRALEAKVAEAEEDARRCKSVIHTGAKDIAALEAKVAAMEIELGELRALQKRGEGRIKNIVDEKLLRENAAMETVVEAAREYRDVSCEEHEDEWCEHLDAAWTKCKVALAELDMLNAKDGNLDP